VNSSLMIKSEDETLATLDVADFNMFTGKMKLLKAGACTTYIKKNSKLYRKDMSSLPVGILNEVKFAKEDITLNDGDIITVDCGAGFNGICTDACRTFAVGKISEQAQELINVTRNCFYRAVEKIKPGIEVAIVGKTIENYIDKLGNYSILENYCGHGIGKNLHEDPLIPNYIVHNSSLQQHTRKKFQMNTAVCIEPMIFQSKNNKVKVAPDGWTVISTDGALSAHYENTVLVTANGVEILTNSDEN